MDARSPHQRIVLVEDDPALRSALAFAFDVDGYQVEALANAEAARGDRLAGAACLVVDYWLPDGNGLDLLERLRAEGLSAPAILITSQPKAPVRDRAAGMGISLVEKPLLSDDLVKAVRRLIQPDAAVR